jgi:aspartate-semialdehyde dehydrogenase
MPRQPILTILDPTSLLGRDIADALATSFPEIKRRLFHTREEDEHLIAEVTAQAALVPRLTDPDEMEGSLAVVVTTEPSPTATKTILDWLRRNPSTALVDCSQAGIAPEESQPVINRLPARWERRWFAAADPLLAGPARVLSALSECKPDRARLLLFSPASNFGEDAIDELASQATARLSGYQPKRPQALPRILAFDMAPASPNRVLRLDKQLSGLFPETHFSLDVFDTGVFHGHLASMAIHCQHPPNERRARALLDREAGFVRARANETPCLTGIVGENRVLVGDLAVEDDTVLLYIMSDGLRLAGPTAVVDIISALIAT